MLEHSQMPDDKRILLYTLIRVQHSLAKNDQRKLLVQVRLQALSILAYSEEIEENDLIYRGLIKELVDVLMIDDFLSLPDIKAASMNTLTAIIHLKKTNIIEIIETAQIASYHGLLPKLVRKCVEHFIDDTSPFPNQFSTSLFDFVFFLAEYKAGADALVKCGILESLLELVNQPNIHIFANRAVDIIGHITNFDTSSFETYKGLNTLISRLAYEVNECLKEIEVHFTLLLFITKIIRTNRA